MAGQDIMLHHKNIEKVLKSQGVAALVNQTARRVADLAGPDADVDEYTTDRGAASVAVPAEQQAIDGVLTRAAAAAGLEISQKP